MNSATWELVKPISNFLYGYTIPAAAIIVNLLTLNVKQNTNESTNSVLFISPMGSGKTTLISDILQKSNPKWCPPLPEKMFERDILKFPDDYFKRKVWCQDDLITTFRGTTTKQREQLMGAMNTLLTKGEYGRNDVRKSGRIVCLFGLAEEHYDKHKKQMLQSTFEDRFAKLTLKLSIEEKKKIVLLKANSLKKAIPKLQLPFKRPTNLVLPQCMVPKIIEIATRFENEHQMSLIRAYDHISNFLKSNAIINHRGIIDDDLKLFKLLLPLYFGLNASSIRTKIAETIIRHSMDSQAITQSEIIQTVRKSVNCQDDSVIRNLASLRLENAINYEPTSDGGDIYWI